MAQGTRDKLIETGAHLFWERGYRATSIADICRAADVNPGSMYYFFPEKHELLVAVLEWYRDNIDPGLLAPAWEGVSDPIDRIFALLAAYRQNLIDTDLQYGCPIGNLTLELASPPERVQELLAENFNAWIAAVRSCLDGASDRFSDHVDLDELALMVLTTMEGAVMQAKTQKSIAPFDGSVARLRHYFDLITVAD